ncbi:MAG TPA: ATP-binding protein [Gemmatimonadales bacterium]|nr:ATP-binding protein [Gemmatimonadales bacterium]
MLAAINGLVEGVVIHDADGVIVAANPAAERILGLTLAQLQGRSSLDERWHAVREDGTPFPDGEHPAMVTLRTGRPCTGITMGLNVPTRPATTWIEVDAQPFALPGSARPDGVVVSFADVTHTRQVGAQQYRLTQLLQTLFASEESISRARDESELFHGVCTGLATQGLVRLAWIGLVDAERQKLEVIEASGPATDYLHAMQVRVDDSPEADGPSGRCIRTGRPQLCQDVATDLRMAPWREAQLARGIHSSGAFPLRRRGAVIGALTVYFDAVGGFGEAEVNLFVRLAESISFALDAFENARDLRQTQAQLLQSQKMEAIGRLAGGVAHDFNNLLGVIIGQAELLHDGLPPDPLLRTELAEIRRAAERAAELTRRLLTFSRQTPQERRVVDLVAVVSGMEAMLRRLIGEDITLHVALPADQVAIFADPHQLEQVVMNLVVNARDAMPEGGVLTVGVGPATADTIPSRALGLVTTGEQAHLWVSDTGTGMTPAVLARIFEPFFTTKPAGKGTGLGLATVFGIVTQSDGRLWVDSTVGSGTTMHVALPRATEATATAVATETARPSAAGAGQVVLVVEDEPVLQRVIVQMLERAGYRALLASDGDTALAQLRGAGPRPQLVLTDLVLPGRSGVALATELAVLAPGLPVLFMSGYAAVEAMDQVDPARFLPKPFTRDELLQAVARALGRS